MPHFPLHLLIGLAIAIAAASMAGGPGGPSVLPARAQDLAVMCPTPADFSGSGVTVGLQATFPHGDVVSFGLPLPVGAVQDAASLAITQDGAPLDATVTVLLDDLDPAGTPVGVRSVLVQLSSSVVEDGCAEVAIAWQGGRVTVTDDPVPYADTSAASDEAADVATYSIEDGAAGPALVTTDRHTEVFYTSREPAVLATFPPGYLAATGILGQQIVAGDLGPELAGLQFISDAVTPFGLSAMYHEPYPLNAAKVIDPTDPEDGYEGWLYDRCATFIAFYVHTGDLRFLREGYRLCAWYADRIALDGENRGIFTGKPDPDPKYSHLRGLYAYYALTGDGAALAAGSAIASRFLEDQDVVAPYRTGRIGDLDGLWTERLLAVSIEALTHGHLLTGDPAYLTAATELVATAQRHITGDATALAAINPGAPEFPPQNCFIHTAGQAAEGDAADPWCSGWMPALLVDPLLAYQAQSGDPRVDDILIRLTRYLRDTGSAYFDPELGNAGDTFLAPAAPFDPADTENPRVLVPLYGAGIDADGQRRLTGEYDDYLHCLDVTAITAAGLNALRRTGGYDLNPVGPFASEGESFLALHQEFAACASWALADQARPHRDPATWTAQDLAEGLDDPVTFIDENNIANSSHNVTPARKISWWFNPALGQFALLQEAGVSLPDLQPGSIPGSGTDAGAAPWPPPVLGPVERVGRPCARYSAFARSA